MKILVVDDDCIALSLIEAALAQYGYTNVTTATSAEEAMDAIKRAGKPFDCFLLDYRMPGVDGADLCAQIRRFREYRSTSIIFVTGVSDRASVNAAFAVGAVDYVSKPIDPLAIGIRVSFAEKIVLEERQKQAAKKGLSHTRKPVGTFPEFSFSDRVPIFNVTGVTSLMAVENYLQGLGKGTTMNCAVTAITIDRFDQIFERARPARIYFFLTEIAKVIAASLKRIEPLICYNGYGDFLCVTKRTDLTQNSGTTRLINSRVSRLNLAFEDDSPYHASVSIGKPAQSSLWATDDPRELIDAALQQGAGSGSRDLSRSGSAAGSFSSPILNM